MPIQIVQMVILLAIVKVLHSGKVGVPTTSYRIQEEEMNSDVWVCSVCCLLLFAVSNGPFSGITNYDVIGVKSRH